MSLQSLSLSLCKFGPKRLRLGVAIVTRTGLYIKVEVRNSKPCCKSIPLVIIIVVSITITALKIRDILTYFLVPFILYIVYRLISRFTAYKALFALVAVLMVRGVVLLVGGVVLSVGIVRFNLLFLFTVRRD